MKRRDETETYYPLKDLCRSLNVRLGLEYRLMLDAWVMLDVWLMLNEETGRD
jgi:hypothetical protein